MRPARASLRRGDGEGARETVHGTRVPRKRWLSRPVLGHRASHPVQRSISRKHLGRSSKRRKARGSHRLEAQTITAARLEGGGH